MTKKRKRKTDELRAKMNEDAALKLQSVVEQAKAALQGVATDTCVSVPELAKMIAKPNKTLAKTIQRRLVSRAERELFELYNQQLPIKKDAA